MENKIINDLETLDISVLLDSLYENDQFDFVLKLLEHARLWKWKVEDLYHNFHCFCSGDSELDEEIARADAETIKGYHRYFEDMDSCILVLLDVFGSMVRILREDCHSKGLIVDMKILLDLQPKYRIEFINMCLEYVDKGIEAATKIAKEWKSDKLYERVDKVEELKATLIAIRDEDLKIIEEEKEE